MSQLKIKNGNNWESIPAGGIGVPSGGNEGDILVKSSAADYAAEWEAPPVKYSDLYYGSHTIRALGIALDASNVHVGIPWMNPDGETPTVSISSASIAGIGSITSYSVDSDRTNRNAIWIKLTKSSGFTTSRAYLCMVSITLS